MEDAATAVAAVEVQVSAELLRLFIEDVNGTVEIGHEEAICASGFFTQRIHSGEEHVIAAFTVDEARHRHGDVVSNFQCDFGGSQLRNYNHGHDDHQEDVVPTHILLPPELPLIVSS